MAYFVAMPFVRAAAADDVPILSTFEWTVPADAIANGECFVAGETDVVQAWLTYSRGFYKRPYVDQIFVLAKARQRGLGDALLAHVESICPESKLWISTALTNIPMQRLLHRRGYQVSGVIHGLARTPEIVYFKPINLVNNDPLSNIG